MKKSEEQKEVKINIVHVQSHGLLKGVPVMYGSDNGGQLTYLLGAAKAQKELEQVRDVHILTRKVSDLSDVHASDEAYRQEREEIKEGGPVIFRRESNSEISIASKEKDAFLKKEDLWPTLTAAADNLVQHIKDTYKPTDRIILQLHYADAGFVGAMALEQLRKTYPNLVTVFVGHSLGHDKFNKLMQEGDKSPQDIEIQYNISTRIAAELTILKLCDVLVTSTEQELNIQYAPYKPTVDRVPRKVSVWAGIDPKLFKPEKVKENEFEECILGERIFKEDPLSLIGKEYKSLNDPDLPPVIALCRPDERKNICKLVEAFANDPKLYKNHNLVLVQGSHPKSGKLTKQEDEYFQKLRKEINKYPQLKGKIVCPSEHEQEDIPKLMRWGAEKKGVFANPALTEPFGLTILEAGACGLPVVATENGGPSEMIPVCKHGVLVDPYSTKSITSGLLNVLSSNNWGEFSKNGVVKIPKEASQEVYAKKVVDVCKGIMEERAALSQSQEMVSSEASQVEGDFSSLIGKNNQKIEFFTTFETTRKSVCEELHIPYVRREGYYNTEQTKNEQERIHSRTSLRTTPNSEQSLDSLARIPESLEERGRSKSPTSRNRRTQSKERTAKPSFSSGN